MRAVVEGVEVEGTPEEVAAFVKAHRGLSAPSGGIALADSGAASADLNYDDDRFASERVAYRALRRRPLSSAQRKLFRRLLDAYPAWVSASDLQAITEYSPNQLGGLLGAIGRRLSQTEGYVVDSAMLEWMWDADENEYAYRLPPSVMPAVRRIDP